MVRAFFCATIFHSIIFINMKKLLTMKYSWLLVLVFCAYSCSDSDDTIIPACNINNPIEDLQWLKAEVDRRNNNPTEDMKYCYIVQGTLNGEDTFVYGDCNPLVDKAIFFLNCEGNAINTQDNPIGFDDLQNKVIIWKPRNFACKTSF